MTIQDAARELAPALTHGTSQILQQPDWADPVALGQACRQLSALPGLVGPASVTRLRRGLGLAAGRHAVVVQAGDCAEAFGTAAESVRGTLALLDEIAGVLGRSANVPVLQIGRLAGQYAKPRSSPVERIGNLTLPSFRGHIVHDHAPDNRSRRPDPRRLVRAYYEAAATLNVVRSSSTERGTSVWVSHEALLLDYERALLRWDPRMQQPYGSSGHQLWLGERTRQPDGPHVRFLAGLTNPVACKLGPRATVDDVRRLCEVLDPDRVPGRLTLISRMGADHVEAVLPPLIRAVRDLGYSPLWMCDPMHGNTFLDARGVKTRCLRTVVAEVIAFVRVHRDEGSWPGGVHLELTGDDVVECTDHPGELVPPGRSSTLCDPRLNARQSIQLAQEVGRELRR